MPTAHGAVGPNKSNARRRRSSRWLGEVIMWSQALADPEDQRARALGGKFQKGTPISENSSNFASLQSNK